MTEEYETKIEQSAWNLSQHDLFLMGDLWRAATYKFLKGEYQSSFFDTVEIRNLIHTDLDADEDEKLDKIESKVIIVYRLLQSQLALLDNEEDEEEDLRKIKLKLERLKNQHAYYVTKYRRTIREAMGKYGYLFSKKRDITDLRF